MFLLPIGHEDARFRRVPWVTFGIMILCGVAFLLSGRAHPRASDDQRLVRDIERTVRYWAQHPYLELDEDFRERIFPGQDEEEVEAILDEVAGDGEEEAETGSRVALQRRLDELVARATKRLDDNAVLAWGLVPQRRAPATFVTHMFLHAGWLHLLGNMLFLFVAGPLIEDLWGRPVFALFYLTCGLLAALTHIGADPTSTVPMIGASGAIAGVMGAFLVRAGATKIRFLYLIAGFFGGTFSVPAWIMLPIWLLLQLGYAALTHGAGAGVAYWAHIGGFVAGACFAFVIAATRAEERWLRPAIDRRVDDAIIDNQRLDDAMATRFAGDHEGAFDELYNATLADPANVDVIDALREMAAEQDRFAEAVAPLVAAIRARLRERDEALAVDLWTELLREAPEVFEQSEQAANALGSSVLVRLGQALSTGGDRAACRRTLVMAIRASQGRMTAPTALRIAEAARFVDAKLARQSVDYALARPDIDPASRATAERMQAELGSLPALV